MVPGRQSDWERCSGSRKCFFGFFWNSWLTAKFWPANDSENSIMNTRLAITSQNIQFIIQIENIYIANIF
jgi:hypothetical protein